MCNKMTGASTKVVQVTNIAPQATKDQMQVLFGYLGKVEDIRLYPTIRDVSCPVSSRICYIKFVDLSTVAIAQHMTNTVFIDRALIVLPVSAGEIPDEYYALEMTRNGTIVPGLTVSEPKLPSHVTNIVHGTGTDQVILTTDNNLDSNELPPYPPLPASYDSTKIEETRRTVIMVNYDSSLSNNEIIDFFNQAGEVKYMRTCTDAEEKTHMLVEFTEQGSVVNALKMNGSELKGKPVEIQHATQPITKPQTKSNEAAQKEIEEAMIRFKEAQNMINASIEPVIGMLTKDKRNSKRSRSRSRDRRRRSRSRSRPRRRSRSRRRRSTSRRRSRSRDRKKRSKSRSRKRSRSRSKRSASKPRSSDSKTRRADSKSRRSASKTRRSASKTRRSRSKSRRERPKSRERSSRAKSRDKKSRERSPEKKSRGRSRDRSSREKKSKERSRDRKKSRERERRSKDRDSKEKEKDKVKRESKEKKSDADAPEKRKTRSRSKSKRRSRSRDRKTKERRRSRSRGSRSKTARRRSPTPPRSSRRRSRSRSSDRDKKRDKKSDRRDKDKADRKEKRRSRSKSRSDRSTRSHSKVPRNYDEEDKGFETSKDKQKQAKEVEEMEEGAAVAQKDSPEKSDNMDISNSP